MRSLLSGPVHNAELTSLPKKLRTSFITTAHKAPNWRFSILTCERCTGPLVMYGEDGFSFSDPIWLYPAVDDQRSQLVPNALRIELVEAKRLAFAGFDLPAVLMCGRAL